MSSVTSFEKILAVLIVLVLIVSGATLGYLASLSSTLSEVASIEREIASSMREVRSSIEELAASLGERVKALEEAMKPKPIIMGTTDKITVLDPAKAYDFYTWEVFNNIGEGLLKYRPGTTELEPGIAESYEVSRDGSIYTFKLRKGLKFTDGADLNASAVKYSIDRVMRLGLDPSWLVSAFVDRVEVVDTYTVRFILKKPVSYFPSLVATVPYFPVSPKSYPPDEVAEPTVGHYGPYKIKSWVRDVELILEANPGYYGSPPKTPVFAVKFYKDAASMRLAVEAGEIDIAWRTLRPMDVQDLKRKGVLTVEEVPGPYIRYIVLRCKDKPFDDVKLRRAVAAAVDRGRIVEEVYKGTV
ncbi:MAG: ABC transporter substrate-binding protein, partial [Candidatus Bathyarchaeia archaeon]